LQAKENLADPSRVANRVCETKFCGATPALFFSIECHTIPRLAQGAMNETRAKVRLVGDFVSHSDSDSTEFG